MALKSVLVTGGAGFVGSHLVDLLIDKGYSVRILDNLDPQVHPNREKPDYLNKNAEFIQGDVRDTDTVLECLKGIDVVFHQAAKVGVGQSMYQIREYTDVNIRGTAVLLDCIVNYRRNVEKIIVAGSMSSYGDTGTVPVDEKWDLMPASIYAITKQVQEQMVLNIGEAYKIPAVALRYFNIYGPRQSLSNPYTGVVAIFISALKNYKHPIIYEDGKQTRDFISVHDVAMANYLAMLGNASGSFNVGTGTATSILKLAHTLADLMGKDIKPYVTNRKRVGDIRHCIADTTKACEVLGFSAKIPLESGLIGLIGESAYIDSVDNSMELLVEMAEKNLVE